MNKQRSTRRRRLKRQAYLMRTRPLRAEERHRLNVDRWERYYDSRGIGGVMNPQCTLMFPKRETPADFRRWQKFDRVGVSYGLVTLEV